MDLLTLFYAIDNPNSYFQTLPNEELKTKREIMKNIILNLGLDPIIPDGGYFMIADARRLKAIKPNFEGEDQSRPWDVQCKS